MINPTQLLPAIQFATEAIRPLPRHISILETVRIASASNWITITSTNLEQTTIAVIPAPDCQEFQTCVHPKFLMAAANQPEPISLKLEHPFLRIQAGGLSINAPLRDPDEFPRTKNLDRIGELRKEDLRTICGALAFSSIDESRYILNGVRLDKTTRLRNWPQWVIATDGRRMQITKLRGELPFDGIIPNKALQILERALPQTKGVEVFQERQEAGFLLHTDYGTAQLQTKLIEGTYPNVGNQIQEEPVPTFRWESDLLLQELQHLEPLQDSLTIHSDQNGVFLQIKDASLKSHITPLLSREINISFNNSYLQSICRALPGETVQAKLSQATIDQKSWDRPLLNPLQIDTDEKTLLLMPMRLNPLNC